MLHKRVFVRTLVGLYTGRVLSARDELLLVGEQDCQDPRKICEGLIRSKERKDGGWRLGNKMLKRQRQRKAEEQGLRKTRCPQFRTTMAQRKSKCARIISLPRFPFLSFTFHPRVFPRKSAIPLERNFPDIRSTGFRFRFLFCASCASTNSPICLSSHEHMTEMKRRTKIEEIL